jgi:predicted transglutaminase-like cysteine proteinase
MKKLLIVIAAATMMASCATGGSLSSGQSTSQPASAEAQAKELTGRMKTVLALDKAQEDRVMSINVVNQKLLQRIRQSNDQSIAASAKENYHKELKGVLSADQFSKFRSSFPNL